MQIRRGVAVLAAAYLFLFLFPSAAAAHDIKQILAKFPEFSTFSNLLSQTQLAADINRRQTITVLAVENGGLAAVVAKNPPINVLRNVLSLHVLLDYFDDQKLHNLGNGSAISTTVFQSSGLAVGTAGLVNITYLKGGTVTFSPKDNSSATATYVKSVQQIPYNISVIQVSTALPPPATQASPAPPQPAPKPSPMPPSRAPSPMGHSPCPSPPAHSPSPSPPAPSPSPISPSPVPQPPPETPPADANPPEADGGAGSPPKPNGAVKFNGRKLGAVIFGVWVMISLI